MSKVTPREYYVCDYCGKKFDNAHSVLYTNNSGLNNICYDMCSDECLKNHLRFLKGEVCRKKSIAGLEPIEEYFKNVFWINGKSYHCVADNAEELFDRTIVIVKRLWQEIQRER